MSDTNKLEELTHKIRKAGLDLMSIAAELNALDIELQRAQIMEADAAEDAGVISPQSIVDELRRLDPSGQSMRAFLNQALRPDELLRLHEETGIVFPETCSRLAALQIVHATK